MGVAGKTTEVSLNLSSDFFFPPLPLSQAVSICGGNSFQLHTARAGSAQTAWGRCLAEKEPLNSGPACMAPEHHPLLPASGLLPESSPGQMAPGSPIPSQSWHGLGYTSSSLQGLYPL